MLTYKYNAFFQNKFTSFCFFTKKSYFFIEINESTIDVELKSSKTLFIYLILSFLA